jgi:hypothetical protein
MSLYYAMLSRRLHALGRGLTVGPGFDYRRSSFPSRILWNVAPSVDPGEQPVQRESRGRQHFGRLIR